MARSHDSIQSAGHLQKLTRTDRRKMGLGGVDVQVGLIRNSISDMQPGAKSARSYPLLPKTVSVLVTPLPNRPINPYFSIRERPYPAGQSRYVRFVPKISSAHR
jgi:hypothetical protein